jgi:glutathione S-transferase
VIVLYHNDMSSCSQKVRLCLAEKGLKYESRHMDLRAGDQQQDWYVKLNPRAVVPTLVDGDNVVPESNVIAEYLDEAYPSPPMMPSTPHGRTRVRLWTKQLDEGIHDGGISVLSFAIAFHAQYLAKGAAGRATLSQAPAGAKRDARESVLEHGLDSPFVAAAARRMGKLIDDMEAAMAGHAWLAGDSYTLADAAFTPYILRLDHLRLLGMLDGSPRVADWYARVRARPNFAVAVEKWLNAAYLDLMRERGDAAWPRIKSLIA